MGEIKEWSVVFVCFNAVCMVLACAFIYYVGHFAELRMTGVVCFIHRGQKKDGHG